MPKTILAACAALLFCGLASAQARDIGLTSADLRNTTTSGQICGSVGCRPFPGGALAPGATQVFTHYSAPQTNYAIVLGLAGSCSSLPRIDNSLLLGAPFLPVGAGLTSAPPFVPTPCSQGLANASLTIPRNAPSGLVFRVQSVGLSPASRVLAFGPTIEFTIR